MHQFLKFILGIKIYMFRTVPLSIIRSFSLYTRQWYMSYRFADSLRAGSGWNVLILLDPGVSGRIILRWILRTWGWGAWTGLIWLRIATLVNALRNLRFP
jgi:hypothetical protein